MSTSPTASANSGKPGISSMTITAGPSQRVEALQSQLQGVPGKFSYRALDRAGRQSAIDRRTLLKSLLLLLGVGGSGFLYQSPLGRELRADYRTATGEIKPIVLSDGTQLVLNTASAVDVHYDDRQRLIRLHAGKSARLPDATPGRCGCKARRERCARSAPAFWCVRVAARLG